MSLRLEMLQVSRLAPRLLGESADLVRDFVSSQWTAEGGFGDRAGRPDLYYTVFGLNCLQALQVEIPRDRIEPFLRGFGDGEGLDLVHFTCLARAWAAVGGLGDGARDDAVREGMVRRLQGFLGEDDSAVVTDRFLLHGAFQDLGAEPPATEDVEALLRSRQSDDGGYINEPPAIVGGVPSTVAAVTLLASLQRAVPAGACRWLESRHGASGGFTAAPGIAVPDLLSTAVVLHALASAQRPLTRFVEPCLDFIDSLWTNRGAFHGHWADEELDCEYTFYGLLALGHLSVWSS